MGAGKIARIADVDLHGLHLGALEQLRVVHARIERLDIQALATRVQLGQIDALAPARQLQRMLRLLEIEQPHMLAARAHAKMRRIAALLEHDGHIAADGNGTVLDQADLVGQVEIAAVLGQRAQIRRRLTVVLFAIFQIRRFNRAHRMAVERRASELGGNAEIPDVQLFDRHVVKRLHPVIGEHAPEILDVQSARQALAAQDRIVVKALRHAAVAEHVAEIQLAAGLEHAKYFLEQLFLERRQIDDAVAYDNVDALVGNHMHVLDEALDELDVGFVVPEPLHLLVLVAPREFKLGRRHVDTDDLAVRPHELARDVHVAPRPAPQVQHRSALERRRNRRPAPIEPRDNLVIHVLQRIDHVLGRSSRSARARIRAQIITVRQNLPVIPPNLFANLLVFRHFAFLTRKMGWAKR